MVASEFVSELRQRYGIEFHDLSLLDEAFTHLRMSMNIKN